MSFPDALAGTIGLGGLGLSLSGALSPSTPDYAGTALSTDARRRKLINQGLTDINAVFSGGTLPNYVAAGGNYNPHQTYYHRTPSGSYAVWNQQQTNRQGGGSGLIGDAALGAEIGSVVPGIGTALGGLGGAIAGLFDGGGNGPPPPPNYKKLYGTRAAKGGLFTLGTPTTYAGFTPQFYNNAAQSYVNYQLPQLGQQYKQANDQLRFGLANKGLLGSSAQTQGQSALNIATGQQEQNIADQAISTAQNLQTQVETARQNAINQLYQTASPSNALQQSVSSAAGFQVPQTFTPLANTFSGILNQFAYNPASPLSSSSYFYNYNPYSGLGGSVANTPTAS